MADPPDILQLLAGEAVKFFEFVGQVIGDPLGKSALIRDLGGDPTDAPDGQPLPAGNLDSVTAYRDAANPTAEAGAQALADIAVILDAIAANAETWLHSTDAGEQELAHSLLELLASNYFRLHFPRLFMLFQAVALLEDLTSTYGEGSNNLVRVDSSVKSLWSFLVQPGKSLEQLDGLVHPDDKVARYTDFGVRMAATVLGIADVLKAIDVTDVMTGWDGPGVDVDSSTTPAKADLVSERMTSLSFGWQTDGLSTDPSAAGKLVVTTAMVPKDEGGTSVFLALGGSIDLEQPLGNRWKFSAKARSDAGVAALVGARFQLIGPDSGGAFQASIGYASQPDESSRLSFAVPSPKGTRLEVGSLTFTLTLASSGAEMLVGMADSAVVVDSSDSDGFVSEMLGHTPLRLPFSIVAGYSSSRGLVLEGSAPPTGTSAQPNVPLTGPGNVGPPIIAATIPIGRGFGSVTVHEVAIRVTRGPADAAPRDMNVVTVEADTSFSAQIGPVYVRLDQLGLLVSVDGSKPPAERNLRFVDLHPGIKFPRGVAINVETSDVAGGGSILHDPDLGLYFGTMDLAIRGGLTAKAIGLIATKNADGTKGFSMVLILTIELATPWPLGMGFELQGFGGMLVLHRTFDEAAMRAALPTGQLRNVLFPSDPVHHTTEVLHSLQALFPARRGSHMFGVLAKIGWASPTLVQFELAVIYEWGNQHRLIILGRVSAILPRTDEAIIKLNMDALGVVDFDAGTFALDAVLYDSRFCGRFVLTGAMAMRMAWQGQSGFALAVGGLHPKFTAPAGFPNVARVQLALTNGDNPKLICQSYFAITSNTVQFGADCSLYAAAFGFSVEGDVGFDVLIQLLPFHFLADYRASVQLKRGSHNLFKVSVAGELEGPLPLRVAGKASFEILWCDFSVSFNTTLVDGGTPNDVLLIDVLAVLFGALTDPRAWQAQLPPATGQIVSLRQPITPGILLHPLGTLTVRQNIVPLNLTRDIDRVGTGTPGGDRRFTITAAAIGATTQSTSGVQELFAPAQYFDMSDDEKLAAPSFEPMDAGVSFGGGGYTIDFAAKAVSAFEYTDIIIGPDGAPALQPDPHVEDGARVLVLTLLSAAGGSAVRRTLTRRFHAPVNAAAPTVNPAGWAAIPAAGAPSATTTWAEARGAVLASADPSSWVLVPASELTS
jgi:hypothetical protein